MERARRPPPTASARARRGQDERAVDPPLALERGDVQLLALLCHHRLGLHRRPLPPAAAVSPAATVILTVTLTGLPVPLLLLPPLHQQLHLRGFLRGLTWTVL